ncbi:hypothetical protein A464_1323 [Salmonella bongori N268-08]|uniref:Uncharacterized protein n=1 Tax=Salmonella bongori N268-08 TaxID=1197719 RepID=S5MV47_SALBN|nr:hypothetical protein A464_1323 [Salmonella bongori N268-08]
MAHQASLKWSSCNGDWQKTFAVDPAVQQRLEKRCEKTAQN